VAGAPRAGLLPRAVAGLPHAVGLLPRAMVGLPRAVVGLPRAALQLPRFAVRLPRAAVPGPHGRRRLAALALLAAVLGAGYVFWLRDSSLVRVERVTVTGLDHSDAARIRAKLAAAAQHMTTLHVDDGALQRAVADEPIVQSLSIQTDFPHGLAITIVQNRPVAMLVAGGREVAVAPDGTLLAGTRFARSLPTVRVAALPAKGHVPNGAVRDEVVVAAAAPPRLLARVQSISIQHGRGIVAQLEHGPVVIFGRPVELGRKWTAAGAVLAQHSSQGATYIDVRMPDRPVAGGLGVQLDPQPQAQALAAGAQATPPGGVGTSAAAGPTATAPATPQTVPPASQSQVSPSPAPSQTPAAPTPASPQTAPVQPATPAAGAQP
jgi:cell division protein FtsQ